VKGRYRKRAFRGGGQKTLGGKICLAKGNMLAAQEVNSTPGVTLERTGYEGERRAVRRTIHPTQHPPPKKKRPRQSGMHGPLMGEIEGTLVLQGGETRELLNWLKSHLSARNGLDRKAP